jgi:hypothetical protein
MEHFQEKHKSQSKIESLGDMKVCICKSIFVTYSCQGRRVLFYIKSIR